MNMALMISFDGSDTCSALRVLVDKEILLI
jgi:hypothetical protein